jgi:mycofactocin precursor
LAGRGTSVVSDRLVLELEEPMVLADEQDIQDAEESTDAEIDELLVEEVSIDGMCGVY